MISLENYLTSGFDFRNEDYELKSRYILMNGMFSVGLIIISVLMVLLLMNGQFIFAAANGLFIIITLAGIVLLRVSRRVYQGIVPLVIGMSILLVSMALMLYPTEHLRIAWFLDIIILAYFLGGKKLGVLATIMGLLALYIVSSLKEMNLDPYTMFLAFAIIILGSLFVSHYERRSKKAHQILVDINQQLEEKVRVEAIKRTEKLKEQKAVFEHLAHHDTLTGLPNRTLFYDRLEHAIARAKRTNTKLALLFLDLDYFKEINDSLGHHIGDKVLKIVAQRLQNELRISDTIARLGGDEFTILLEDVKQSTQVVDIALKLLLSLKASVHVEEHEIFLTVSIGISTFPEDGESVQTLVQNADAAMYGAKQDGRNTYRYYAKTMTQEALQRLTLETSMRHALENGEFLLYYQPQIDTQSQKLVGMEALIRWYHPEQGLISPSLFIPLAEMTQFIIPLGEWIFKTACKQARSWHDAGFDPGRISVNFSANQLRHQSVIPMITQTLEESGCRPEWVELEITESYTMQNPEQSVLLLEQIKAIGMTLAIDDFGTGYSSLSYLKRLPIDKLKIDRSFIKDIPECKEDETITKTIISMAKSLELSLIAEGVETDEQQSFLQQSGCHVMQGFLYCKPMPAEMVFNTYEHHS